MPKSDKDIRREKNQRQILFMKIDTKITSKWNPKTYKKDYTIQITKFILGIQAWSTICKPIKIIHYISRIKTKAT